MTLSATSEQVQAFAQNVTQSHQNVTNEDVGEKRKVARITLDDAFCFRNKKMTDVTV